MALSMARLLIDGDSVSLQARAALQLALSATSDREKHLAAAARAIWSETDLQCGEVRDLVGLDDRGAMPWCT